MYPQTQTLPPPRIPMRRFAFIDLETTGVSPASDRITEIGIVLVDGDSTIQEWSSLVDPGIPIPSDIQALTGITNDMVRDAPCFSQLLPTITRLLAGRIFVAHNARFDYGFIKAEFRRCSDRFSADVLCTVRLSRALFPQYDSHRLDALISRHHLQATDRHRALGDARVLVRFLDRLWQQEDIGQVDQTIAKLLKQPATPPHLAPGALDHLPESPGVYTFVGATGQPLYVGKSLNLRERIRSHFYADSRNANDARLVAEVHTLEVEHTAGEFGALVREIQTIKRNAPLHNIALRKRESVCFIKPAAPGLTPKILKLSDLPDSDPLQEPELYGPFGSRASARAALAAVSKSQRLCDRASGLWAREGACFSRQVNRCAGLCTGDESAQTHHARLLRGLAPMRFAAWPFSGPVVLTERDTESGLTDQWVFDRWRAIESNGESHFDPDLYKLLRRSIKRTPERFLYLGESNN
jgi:DNA polymerase III subunit epsilon